MKIAGYALAIATTLLSTAVQAAEPDWPPSAGMASSGMSQDPPLGWNFFTCTGSISYLDASGNNWEFVYPSAGGYWYVVNQSDQARQLGLACQSSQEFGQQMAVYVINSSSGFFSQVYAP
jgi:hypothetical protein